MKIVNFRKPNVTSCFSLSPIKLYRFEMRPWLNEMFLKIFVLGLLTAFSVYIFQLLIAFDVGKRVFNHRPGPCRRLEGIDFGSEDVALIEPEGIAFITSGIFYMAERPAKVTGEIFLWDFKNSQMLPLKLPIKGMKERDTFRPHGISHFITGDRIRLFVVSHIPPMFLHTIEVFDYDRKNKVLNYVKTIKDKKFVRPNNLIALSDDKLIVSNDGTAQTHFTNLLEILTFYKGGSVLFYDGKDSHWLAQSVFSANGITLDREKKHLLVSHVNERVIGVYKLADDYKSMTEVSRHNIGTAADNLWVDKDGGVWTGAHPVWKDAGAHFADCENLDIIAPSQVIKMNFSPDWKSVDITQVFADEGKLISASAVAVQYNGLLFVGSVCREAVICENPM